MSTLTPGLSESRIGADATAKKTHPRPHWRILKSIEHSKIELLNLPAEVRLLIYDQVMIRDYAIDKITREQRTNAAVHGFTQWTSIAQITDAFNLMQTCRTVYNEARTIFWSKRVFIIHSSPSFGVWPHPDVHIDDFWTQFDLTNPCGWKITLTVESVQAQKMIRKYYWFFPKEPWYSSFWQWHKSRSASVKFIGSDIVRSN